MAESLGDALLTLRTDDSRFNSGINQARGRAEQLGTALDKTSGSSARLGTELTKTGNQAQVAGNSFAATGRQVTASAGAQRAGMQQLSFQIGDVSQQFALGVQPQVIFAQQAGQVIQAIQLMTGGTSKLAAFLGGPWGIAATSAAVVLVPLIGRLFETEEAMKDVEFASNKLGDAQSILGEMFDRSTGRIKANSEALVENLRIKARAGLFDAMEARQRAERAIKNEAGRTVVVGTKTSGTGLPVGYGSMGGLTTDNRSTVAAAIMRDFAAGNYSPEQAEAMLAYETSRGRVPRSTYIRAGKAIADFGEENRNIAQFEDTLKAIDGDQAALARLGFGGVGGGGGVAGGPSGSQRPSSAQTGPSGPTPEETQARYQTELERVRARIWQAEERLATNAEDRAEFQLRQLELDRENASMQVRKDKEYTEQQKADLLGSIEEQAERERELIELAKQAEIEQDAAALAAERFSAQQDASQLQLELADTEAERKRIALEMLAAEEDYLRSKLMAIIFSETTTDAERERAQVALEALRKTAPARRDAVSRANETTIERYLRELNKTPEQINEAIDKISLRGLDELGEGLADVITGAKSLGEVFSNVADQIIADLLRIAIQQAIIKPLANSLFGSSGSGGDGAGFFANLFGSFVGGKATGGPIPTGSWAVVGEAGPELAYAAPGGLGIFSNADSRQMLSAPGAGGGATTVTIPISIDATGADAAGLARVERELARLREELPGQIVSTVQDASDRRILNVGGG